MEPNKLSLAHLPTPIECVERLMPGNRTLMVKRDDLTGSALSGNKIRKLEYLLADAKSRGANRVLTCGGIQSNHCRATAVAAARVGMESLLFLRTDKPPVSHAEFTGNLRLDHLVGAETRFITHEEYRRRNDIMSEVSGPDDYVIPEGGSNGLGAWGYIRAIDEMIEQWPYVPSSIVCATGSGGTLAGLAIGVRRRGLQIPVYGICVCDDAPHFQKIVARISSEATEQWPELPQIQSHEVQIIEGYVGRGYALSTDQEYADIQHVARATGLILDPVYTGKAFRSLLHESTRFGDAPLFIHTGGIFGLLA